MLRAWREYYPIGAGLLLSSVVGAGLFGYCILISHSLDFSYLLWNLMLAWIPLIISVRLVYILKYKLWSSWEAIGLSFLWIIFLPNSFYMISDFIHLQDIASSNVIYYAVTFTSIIYSAVLLGFVSLYLIHRQIRLRFTTETTYITMAIILVCCSLAIYIGRDLRWNSWDVLTNPGGLIFDISERLIHISDYQTALATGCTFFVLLASMYFLCFSAIKVLRREHI